LIKLKKLIVVGYGKGQKIIKNMEKYFIVTKDLSGKWEFFTKTDFGKAKSSFDKLRVSNKDLPVKLFVFDGGNFVLIDYWAGKIK